MRRPVQAQRLDARLVSQGAPVQAIATYDRMASDVSDCFKFAEVPGRGMVPDL
jgi:hypothetical protein